MIRVRGKGQSGRQGVGRVQLGVGKGKGGSRKREMGYWKGEGEGGGGKRVYCLLNEGASLSAVAPLHAFSTFLSGFWR